MKWKRGGFEIGDDVCKGRVGVWEVLGSEENGMLKKEDGIK